MLDQVLAAFGVAPDYDLDLMRPGQSLTALSARLLGGLEPVMAAVQPSLVVVQGDTTTTLCGALAGFHARGGAGPTWKPACVPSTCSRPSRKK